MVESIAVVVFGYGGQHIVAGYVDGLQQIGGDAPEGGVGGQQLCQRAKAPHQGDYEDGADGPA